MNSLDKFSEWHPKNETHQKRFENIVLKHAINATRWVSAFQKYPITEETFMELTLMLDELRNLSIESKEVIEDLEKDNLELIDIFETFQEEIDNG